MEKKAGFTTFQWLTLVTLMISSFMGRLDGTIVNLALPKIISDFGITVSAASWITTAYIIANAIFVPIFGKLGDLIGRKPLYLFGIIGFTITSALAGLSFNLSSMVFFRVLQAITVSIDYPLALSIIAVTFVEKNQRSIAMGMWSGIFAAAQVFGPLLGGPLIDAFSWRAVFYVNIPIGIIATIMSIRFIEEPVKKIKGIKHFDVWGSILLGICLGTMVLVLDQGQSWGWVSTKSIVSYIITGVSLVSFLLVENKAKEPVVDLKFFKNITFTMSLLTSFISFMGLIGGIFLIPIFSQTYLGYSVTKAGYVFIPMSFAILLGAQMGARLSQKIQPRYLVAFGMFFAAFGMWLFSGMDIKWTFFDLSYRLILLAFGVGLGLAPLTTAATSVVPIQEVGIASSLLALARNIAGAFGTAIFATVLSNSITTNMIALQQHTVITNMTSLQEVVPLMIVKANILSYQTVFSISILVMILGGIAALFIRQGTTTSSHVESNIEM